MDPSFYLVSWELKADVKSAGRTPGSSQLACALNKESGSRRVGGALAGSPAPPWL